HRRGNGDDRRPGLDRDRAVLRRRAGAARRRGRDGRQLPQAKGAAMTATIHGPGRQMELHGWRLDSTGKRVSRFAMRIPLSVGIDGPVELVEIDVLNERGGVVETYQVCD